MNMENLEHYRWLFTLPALIGVGLSGMVMHFFSKKIKGETVTDIRNYFRDNFKSTVIAVFTTIVAVAALYFTVATGKTIDLIAVFSTGLGCDSIFNKWEAKANS